MYESQILKALGYNDYRVRFLGAGVLADSIIIAMLMSRAPRKAEALIYRLGLDGTTNRTFEDCGILLGVQRQRAKNLFDCAVRMVKWITINEVFFMDTFFYWKDETNKTLKLGSYPTLRDRINYNENFIRVSELNLSTLSAERHSEIENINRYYEIIKDLNNSKIIFDKIFHEVNSYYYRKEEALKYNINVKANQIKLYKDSLEYPSVIANKCAIELSKQFI